jgi:oxygen-independent coproporphyrinogen-3 oxidase
MLNALRLSDGFSTELFWQRTGLAIAALGDPLNELIAEGLLEEISTGRWRPSARGFQFLNDLQARFLP